MFSSVLQNSSRYYITGDFRITILTLPLVSRTENTKYVVAKAVQSMYDFVYVSHFIEVQSIFRQYFKNLVPLE